MAWPYAKVCVTLRIQQKRIMYFYFGAILIFFSFFLHQGRRIEKPDLFVKDEKGSVKQSFLLWRGAHYAHTTHEENRRAPRLFESSSESSPVPHHDLLKVKQNSPKLWILQEHNNSEESIIFFFVHKLCSLGILKYLMLIFFQFNWF